MKIFITGGTARLGKELVRIFPDSLHPSHNELDITNKKAVFNFIKNNKPDIIVHCAALTGIRQCEQDKKAAWQTNVEGTENLVKACEKYQDGCYFVYISTACVFYGDVGNYVETDTPYPKNFYALTKLLGEFVVKKLPNHLIVRTNFVAKEKWRFPRAFVDRFGTYLFAEDVAQGIKDVIQAKLKCVVHICGDKKMSMFELARLTTPGVHPMTLKEYDGPKLTIDMTLDTVRWKKYKISSFAK